MSSHIEINPDLNESATLREWYDTQGGFINSYSLSVNPRSNGDGTQQNTNRTLERKTFSQIKSENLGRFNLKYFELTLLLGIVILSLRLKELLY